MEAVDTELTQLNISEQLRANSSFMKIMATLFHYGNQAMNAAQLVIAVRALNLLPLRGETPKSTIQGIISTSRKIARDLKISDPFRIDKDGVGRQAKYAIADEILNGVKAPEKMEIPDEPIILRPVEYSASHINYTNHTGKRQRKPTITKHSKKKSRLSRVKRRENGEGNSDIEVDSEEDEYDFASTGSGEEEGTETNEVVEEDTIADYSLLYSPPTSDIDYIDRINFTEYPIAGHFAIVQQKGYSYPRFRSHEKIKIPKLHCEDKFRVTDITKEGKVIGRLFILADGHGGPGCSEYFVRKTPAAVEEVCTKYDVTTLGDEKVQSQLESEIKEMIQSLDDDYLALKREQMTAKASTEEHVDNDGCTLILNIFLGEWLININVGDSRTVLISAPEPSMAPPTSIENANTLGVDNDYKMDVVFASQDHKPYLEHLARHILENGGEFVDSVQNRIIKVDLDKLREDGNRHAKRVALKNARIRPKDYQAGLDKSAAAAAAAAATATAAAETVTTTTTTKSSSSPPSTPPPPPPPTSTSTQEVTLSDGSEKEEKMETSESSLLCDTEEDPKPVSAANWVAQSAVRTTATNNNNQPQQPLLVKSRAREDRIPSLNVARSCGDLDFKMDPAHKIISCEPDVTFIRISDQPYVDHTILSNGPHKERRRHFLFMSTDGTFDYMYEETAERQNRAIAKVIGPMIEDGEKIGKYLLEEEERVQGQTIEHGNNNEKSQEEKSASESKEEQLGDKPDEVMTDKKEKDVKSDEASPMDVDIPSSDEKPKEEKPIEYPRIPLLYRELTDEEAKTRKIKERTLVSSARYFANREGAHGFFASTLQDYDDCTIILVEI